MKATSIALISLLATPALADERPAPGAPASAAAPAAPAAPAVPADPVGAADGEALRGNVLVWSDATFFTEPAMTATAVHAARLAGERKTSAGQVVAMHVVAIAKDGFVEVEPANDLDCTWSRLQTADDVANLHLFVRRADLAPVLIEPYAQTFPDGTRIALRPGVAVVPATAGAFAVGVRGGEVLADLPPASVGHAYVPDRAKAVTTLSEHEYDLAPSTSVTLGDRSVALAGTRAQAAQRHGDTTLISIQTRCVALDVIAPTRAIHAVDDDDEGSGDGSGGSGGSGLGLGVLELRDHDYIPAGTVLSTPSGHRIAAAAKPLYLIAPPHGKTACVDRRVRIAVQGGLALPTADDDKLRVCAPSSRVIHDKLAH